MTNTLACKASSFNTLKQARSFAAVGGVRKLRWAISGKGKSGGIRVIFYWKRRDDEIWLLTVYGKSERETISAHVLRKIAEEISDV